MAAKKRGRIILVLCFLVTFIGMAVLLWFFRFPSIKGDSMEPTFHDGDTVLAFHVKNPHHGDIVIVWCNALEEYVVKRVMGLPGDVIEIREGRVYRNGIPLYETYVKDQGWAWEMEDVALKLGEDEMYLLGDNRMNSKDSREFGVFYVSDIFGIVLGK